MRVFDGVTEKEGVNDRVEVEVEVNVAVAVLVGVRVKEGVNDGETDGVAVDVCAETPFASRCSRAPSTTIPKAQSRIARLSVERAVNRRMHHTELPRKRRVVVCR